MGTRPGWDGKGPDSQNLLNGDASSRTCHLVDAAFTVHESGSIRSYASIENQALTVLSDLTDAVKYNQHKVNSLKI